MAKAPSLRKARTRGTQRTRTLSTGNALWSWRNGKERFGRARRATAGAKPYTMKVVRTVFNGGHEETYGNATRLVPTQLECENIHRDLDVQFVLGKNVWSATKRAAWLDSTGEPPWSSHGAIS